ncbi:dolichol kinase [Leptopilina boulardi]|uniref:dolichol kinase n=1 Tax=Leptopilina boulardi TaxID=63433 RepID=UPI0021F56B90|nr:dolichol kinase [Leptopilina boulardi]
MDAVTKIYVNMGETIIKNLELNKIRHRTKNSPGLWIGPLMGFCATSTLLYEDHSYSEICLLEGLTGIGLIISCFILYILLSTKNVVVKDFQVVYFLPCIVTSTLLLLVANKGLLVSVAWGSSVGSLSTWGVVQVMSNFPGCFTVGEATAVTHGLVLFLLSAATNIPLRYHLPPIHDNDIATVILQVGIIYVLSLCLVCKIFPQLRQTKQFYAWIFITISLWIFPSLHTLLDRSPILWIFFYIFSKSSRIFLMICWSICFLLAWCFIMYKLHSKTKATTSDRKVFHILASIVFITGLIWEPVLLYMASGVAFALLIVLELLRFLNIPPLGEIMRQGYNLFADEKDEFISLTPLYLLCGLSYPLWMPANDTALLPLLSGVLTVGIGDAAASFVGSNWGKHKLNESRKTMEGLVACIISQLILIYFLAFFGLIEDNRHLLRSTFAVIGVSIVETKTEQVDNLVMPLLMYLCLLL